MEQFPLTYFQDCLGVRTRVLKRNYPDKRFPQYGVVLGEGREKLCFDRRSFDQFLAPLTRQVGPVLFPKLTNEQRSALSNQDNGFDWVSAPPRLKSRTPHNDDSIMFTNATSFWSREPMPGVSTGFVGLEPGLAVLRPLAMELCSGSEEIQAYLKASEEGPFANATNYTAAVNMCGALYPFVEARLPQLYSQLRPWAIEVDWGKVEYVVFHPRDLHFAWKGVPPPGQRLMVADTLNRFC